MLCTYINLDRATERKQALENNFAALAPSNWSLQRFSAIEASSDLVQHSSGTLSNAEKGCFLSHRTLLSQSLEQDGHIFVLEDDAIFAQKSFGIIERMLSALDSNHMPWDLVYTDIAVTGNDKTEELFKLLLSLPTGHCQALDLLEFPFAGATAYIVNKAAKPKLLAQLQAHTTLNIPIDLLLRTLIRNKNLKAYALFPFPTSVSDYANTSQVQSNNQSLLCDVAWNSFRQLCWIDADVNAVTQTLDTVKAHSDLRYQAFGQIMGILKTVTPK